MSTQKTIHHDVAEGRTEEEWSGFATGIRSNETGDKAFSEPADED